MVTNKILPGLTSEKSLPASKEKEKHKGLGIILILISILIFLPALMLHIFAKDAPTTGNFLTLFCAVLPVAAIFFWSGWQHLK